MALAFDAGHLVAGRPFLITHDVEKTLRGYDGLRALAASPQHIVPGHDPLVLKRYPAADACLEDIACRLDLAPSG